MNLGYIRYSRDRKRTSLPRAFLASFFILALASAGIATTPSTALGANAAKAKKKDDQGKKDKKTDSREIQARADFAAGRYAQALEGFANLYAETLHPTYLRNIGRCYMNMDQPDRAANSFRDYLRKAKDIGEDERKEVEGFIADMDKAQKQKEEAAALAAKPPEPAPQPLPPPPQPVYLQPAPPPPPPPATPLYAKGWFWGVVASVVAVGVLGGLWGAGVFSSKDKCVADYTCL